jgi:hypothetical protein
MGFVRKVTDGITGETAADAALNAANIQAQAGREGIEFQRESRDLARADLAPFTQFGQEGLDRSNLLFDQNAQFDFLQGNPLFQQALEQNNQNTLNQASARGRTTAGDTGQQLSENFLLSGMPLLQNQQQNILSALNIGQNSAAGQGSAALSTGNSISDLITGIGASQAAGQIGAANAQQQGINNLLSIGGLAVGASDRRLKTNIVNTGAKHKGLSVYEWNYKWDDNQRHRGFMSDDVRELFPDAVIVDSDGFDMVNYGAI